MALQLIGRIIVALVLLLGTSSIIAADAPVKGDLWQVTSKMSMPGMPNMPAQVTQICAEKVWTHLASGNDQAKCKSTNFQMNGDTATWTAHCQSPAMIGHGKVTRQGPDAYAGSIKFQSSDQGNMTISLDGHRVGECDNPS